MTRILDVELYHFDLAVDIQKAIFFAYSFMHY